MPNEAKVRIGGDSTGANRATDQAKKGVEGVEQATKKANDTIVKSNDQATASEKKFEAAVQGAIQRMKNKQTQAAANAAALRRMGEVEGNRAAVAAGGPALGQQIAGGLARVGGVVGQGIQAGGALGATPALAAAAGAAVALKVGFDALLAASDRRAKQEGELLRLAQERAALVKAAEAEQGKTAIQAAAQGGTALRRFVAFQGNVGDVQAVGSRVGTDAGTATELASLLQGLAPALRGQIEQAFKDAEYLGGSGIEAARSLSSEARESGNLGTMSRAELARFGLGSAGDAYSDNQINAALRPSRDAANIASLNAAGGKVSLAALGTIASEAAVVNAQTGADKDAARVADPVTASLKEWKDGQDRQTAVLEKMAGAEFATVAAIKDLAYMIGKGEGSFAGQAARQRALVNAQ